MRDVSTWPVVEAEPLGRDRKVWLRDPTIPAMLATDLAERHGEAGSVTRNVAR